MKKTISLVLTLVMLCTAALMPSCARGEQDSDKIKILCTVFPLYDWARNVVGECDNVEVMLLVDGGTDLHSFQPSFGDMAKIKDSDIVLYVGGTSDTWVAESVDEDSLAIELCELDDITLYQISADSIANTHTHDDGSECHEAHDHNHAFDEHIWLSLKNAEAAVRKLCCVLGELDSQNAEIYSENANIYISSLRALDAQMNSVAQKIQGQLIFADRFPFVYLLEDYGIGYFAAFEGCSTDTGADFDTVIALAKKIDATNCSAVFVSESPIPDLAESIIAQTASQSVKILVLDSMQSLGRADIDNGTTYLSVMKQNVKTLEESF